MAKRLYIQEIEIRNFRLFQSLRAMGFGQVNLITGRNNSGKTTFLEALFLSLGPANPQLWINNNSRRGLRRIGKNATTIPYLFNKLDVSEPILIDVITRNHSSYHLELSGKGLNGSKRISTKNEQIDSSQENLSTSVAETKSVLEIKYEPANGNSIVTKAVIERDGISLEGEGIDVFPTSVFLSSENLGDLGTDAKRYDELNKKGLVPRFEQLLKPILPNLKRTSLGIENDMPMILADVGYGLVPVSLLGSGTNRLTSILLALTIAKDAVVLIDEIEYSFHHSLLKNVWDAVLNFSQMNSVQVFATTHSDECIRAASDVFSKSGENTFKLHRLSQEQGISEFKAFSINQLDVALESGLDVR
jgi:AAA15 family ATPase/GTPase